MERSDAGWRFIEPDGPQPWWNPIYVECPRCGGRAIARELAERKSWFTCGTSLRESRLVCSTCPFTKDWDGSVAHVRVDGRWMVLERGQYAWVDPSTGKGVRNFVTVPGTDLRFGTPLWLRAECCGGKLLWANNELHLEHLTAFVAGRLRTRPTGYTPLTARLPGWMKEAKNRDEVLRHLGRFRERLTADGVVTRT